MNKLDDLETVVEEITFSQKFKKILFPDKKKKKDDKSTIPSSETPYVFMGAIGSTIDLYVGLYSINNELLWPQYLMLAIGTPLIMYGMYKTNKVCKKPKN